MNAEKYKKVLDYIDKYWQQVEFGQQKRRWTGIRNLLLWPGNINLPNQSISPNHKYFSYTQYYWDTYFTVIGLVVQNKTELAKGMVDNLCFLFSKFGLIPARNTWLSLGRTQPPFLTRMAFEVYDAGGADETWLHRVLEVAEKEYNRVWTYGQRYHKPSGLSLFQPKHLRKLLTTYESGWDVSTRFALGKTHILPVDLNCLLYQYEIDFKRAARIKGDKKEAKFWQEKAQARQKQIDKYFWSKRKGFYFDNDLKAKRVGTLKTLAGFYPLWCQTATKAQARNAVKHLKDFEFDGGLAIVEKTPWLHRQWDYPNGWPPQQFIVITGLRNYGFHKEADRLTRKWLDLNLKIFEQTGELWEKYDVVKGEIGLSGRYPTQPGFAWTNAIFVRLLHDLKGK